MEVTITVSVKMKPSWMIMLADLIDMHQHDRVDFSHGPGHSVRISPDIYCYDMQEWCVGNCDNWTWRWTTIVEGVDDWHAVFEFSNQWDAAAFSLTWYQ